MTQEEKAKAYDEALKRARQIKNGEGDWRYSDLIEIGPALTEIFPQLAESEDERIREFLIDLLSHGTWKKDWPFSPAECVAWLEKQKEPENISASTMAPSCWELEQKEQKQELPLIGGDIDAYFDELRITTKSLTSREWFDEGIKYAQRLQKEQKPVEIHIDNPNIEKFDPDMKITISDSSADGDELLYVCNKSYKIGYRDGKRDAEQKPAEWSEEDKKLM